MLAKLLLTDSNLQPIALDNFFNVQKYSKDISNYTNCSLTFERQLRM